MLQLTEPFAYDEEPSLASHGARTARIAVAIARVMDLPLGDIDAIGHAARLHDVGKTKIDPEILNKPGPLDADEWMELKRHPQIGYDMLRGHVEPKIAQIVLMHHERLDGCGYPGGVSSAQIGMPVRILHVADAYDAITSLRPYQRALPIEHAISELTSNIGTQFDPDPVQALMSIVTYQLDQVLVADQPFRVPSTLAAVS
ncbi:MAG: HD domain-containing protein [Acidimicrobiia bacterium]|nr:HD domain-containing protein [Acidimicrobiia bacterium]